MQATRHLLCAAALLATNAMALDASSLKLRVYSVMLSTSPLCSAPVTVFSSNTPTEMDFLATPTLGSGNPPDATYNCVIIKMSDQIKFTPSTTGGYCVAGTPYTSDVCRSDNGGNTNAPDASSTTPCRGTDPVGTTTAANPVDDVVYLYLTTNPSAGSGGGNTFLQPLTTGSADGLHLTAPLVVSGTARSKFSVNASGKVGEDTTTQSCGMNPPVFGFVKL